MNNDEALAIARGVATAYPLPFDNETEWYCRFCYSGDIEIDGMQFHRDGCLWRRARVAAGMTLRVGLPPRGT